MTHIPAPKRYSWTQPACNDCWNEQHPNREPHRLKDPEEEACAFCGDLTMSGIYVRVDPDTVDYPTLAAT